MSISLEEHAVLKTPAGCPGFSPRDKAAGEVDPSGTNLWVLLRKSTGIEARPAAEFEDVCSRARPGGGKQRFNDLLGVVPEEVFAAEGVKPGAAFKQTVGRMIGGRD